jgi:nucleotide-binding universal stress UspA family protein
MRKILCVIDLTESSGKVLEVAAGIAIACKSHLVALFPYRLIDYAFSGEVATLKSKLETEARQKFNTIKATLPDFEKVSYEFQPEIGFLADRVSTHVKTDRVDMVVIGQEQSINTNDIKGFNLQHLITSSKIPFMIVPEVLNVETVYKYA